MGESKKPVVSKGNSADNFREVRIRFRSSHPLFSEIAEMKHADAVEVLNQLIMDGMNWQRRVGPMFELLLSRSNGVSNSQITENSAKSSKKVVEEEGEAEGMISPGISGDDVLKSFGIGH